MLVSVTQQLTSAPGTQTKFSALCTIKKGRCLEHLKVLCPWHHKSSLCRFQFLCHHHTSVFGVLTSGIGMTGFFTHSGLTSLGENWSWASSSLPTSPDVCWAEPSSTMYGLLCTGDGKVHCWLPLEHLQWFSMLLGLACWLPCKSRTFAAVLL